MLPQLFSQLGPSVVRQSGPIVGAAVSVVAKRYLSSSAGKTQRVLVTGSGGQVGKEITEALRVKYGRENVVASDIRSEVGLSAPFTTLDACDGEALDALVRVSEIDTIVHLVAPPVSHSTAFDERPMLHTAGRSAETVLHTAKVRGLRVLMTSSMAVYGGETARCSEKVAPKPDTIYGIAKRYQEMLGVYYHKAHGVDFRALRLPGSVGPNGCYVGVGDWAVSIFRDALKQGHFLCNVPPQVRLPLIYVNDLTKSLVDLLEADESRLSRRTYNVAGFHTSPAELAEAIDREFPFAIDYEPPPQSTIKASWPSYLDDSTARRDWGWKPEYNLERAAHAMLGTVSRDMHVDGDTAPTCQSAA